MNPMRSVAVRRLRPLAALLAAIAAAAGVVDVARAAKEPSLKSWYEGPVRYIMNESEVRAWKELKDDASRSVFVERFWAKRDPTPNTLVNEYRELFWQRVQDANLKFLDSSKPGWMTDRGKIYILYGPPTTIEEDPNAQTEGITASSSRGLIRWLYEGRPAQNKQLDAIVVVAFVRDASGEYKLSFDPRLNSVFMDWEALKDKESWFWNSWLSTHAVPGGKTDLGVMLDQGTLQAIPSQEQYLIERVETYETYASHPISAELSRYQPQGFDGKGLVTITVSIPEKDYSVVPAILARFTSTDATRPQRIIGEGSFRIEGEGSERVSQGRLFLEPGTWGLTVLVADPQGKSNGIQHLKVEIPRPGEGLRLSDTVLAKSLEPVPYASLASYEEPFLVGSFRVVPLAGRPLRRGDAINLFYEIYGGRAPYRIEYRIEGKEDDGRFTPLGKPVVLEQAQGAQGWSLPTSDRWPQGDYRVRVQLTDAAGATLTRMVPFTVAPREPS